ncbi:MAG: Gfo/Idh/MocA family oxidoreductase [Candidatus Hydrogenedentes bacterium]|nr:Gfo/Idh/MocA family oxidoreductase [Candidatus Hydrogenedentota bacterium]
MQSIGIGLIGSGFIAEVHAESFRHVRGARLLAVASPTPGKAQALADKYALPHAYTDYREVLQRDDIHGVVLCLPNYLHCQAALDAAAAGKHILCEKPMCMNRREADAMIAACEGARVTFMYAEELCFAPKYVRAKQLADEGALGRIYLVKQSEKHFGPHADWFWNIEQSGGGVLFDMGCHGIEFARWVLGRPRVTSVYAHCATYVHGARTRGEDTAHLTIEFDTGSAGAKLDGDGASAMAAVETSWATQGGMDDRAEIYGSEGVTYADMIHGNALRTYSASGYGYAVEKAATTQGWTFTSFEELWNYGFPQEMQHFIDCIQNGTPPAVTAHDGRAVLEIIQAAYASAASGTKIPLPFAPDPEKPITLWRA